MRKITILIIALIIVMPQIVSSQITPDSLMGTYVGEYWFKWEYETEWTVTVDTGYITYVNESNCSKTAINLFGSPYFETEYDFCYGDSDNLFVRFYSQDSLKIIYDDISQPPPNNEIFSKRYYGKKISSDILIHTIDKKAENIKVFPNPFNNQLSIEWGVLSANNIYNLQLLDINGNRIMVYEQLKGERFLIDTKSINSGIYFLQLSSEEIFKTFKLIKI